MINKKHFLQFLIICSCLGLTTSLAAQNSEMVNDKTMVRDSVLRHVVLFKFKDGTSEERILEIREAFSGLEDKIPQILDFEWGKNNSPEGLNKGFTHCFLMSFKSEEDRAVYLPHPDHKAFGAFVGPDVEEVLVVDYWAAD